MDGDAYLKDIQFVFSEPFMQMQLVFMLLKQQRVSYINEFCKYIVFINLKKH